MDEYQVRTWQGWHHHMALSLIAVWFLIDETHRGQQLTPALTLPQVRYGLSGFCRKVAFSRVRQSVSR
jgi:SRSO17 transposase